VWLCRTEGKDTGGGTRQRILKPFLVLSVRGLEARALARQCQYHSLVTTPETFDIKQELLLSGIAPRVSTLCLTDITTHDQLSQALPSIYAYCKQSNTGGGNSLRTRLGKRYFHFQNDNFWHPSFIHFWIILFVK